MRAVFGGSVAGTTRNHGQDLRPEFPAADHKQNQAQDPDKSVQHVRHINGQRISFADLAQLAWPKKTEANLAHIAKVDPRTARRWLADDNEPPADVLGAILCEIMRRYHQRE